jgi:hypothetical protein
VEEARSATVSVATQADGGTIFLLLERAEEARSATFSLAIQYIILKV